MLTLIKKNRSDDETKKIENNFDLICEIPNTGCEQLLANETPISRQWEFLDALRNSQRHPNLGIPSAKPATDATIKDLTVKALKAGKGEGLAAELIELCNVSELPQTMTTFLAKIYEKFSRPVPKKKTSSASSTSQATADQSQERSGTQEGTNAKSEAA